MTRDEIEKFLLQLLDDLSQHGRVASGAYLKARIVETFRGFEETDFGHASFGDFLRSFPSLSIIVRPGTDVEIRRSEDEKPGGTIAILDRGIWQAITDPNAPAAYFDRETRTVVVAPGEGSASRYPLLPKITASEQANLARDFIAELDDQAFRDALLRDVAQRPLTFSSLYRRLHANAAALDQWRRKRADMVSTRLEEWARSNEVNLSGLLRRVHDEPRRAVNAATRTPVKEETGDEADRLRTLIQEALPTMTLEELLAFRFPARFVLMRISRMRH